jgi:hypothetical protein
MATGGPGIRLSFEIVISKGYVWSKFLYKGPKSVFKNYKNTAKKLISCKDFEEIFNVRV